MRLKDKSSIVTGAARGIGYAIARKFMKEGARVAIVDIDAEEGAAAAERLRAEIGGEAIFIEADVSIESDVRRFVEKSLKAFGRIDVLVNNAGIHMAEPTVKVNLRDWKRILDVNLTGVFLCSREVVKHMIKRKTGTIINIASIDGIIALPERAAYCVSKAGVIQLTKVLAVEWAKYGIRVNAIAPGYTKTEMVKSLIERGVVDEERVNRRSPMGRMASPSEIANAALYLASEESSYVTGETLIVDGGWTAYGYY